MSFNDNSMVVDGKIVNIRQFVRRQDSSRYKTMSESERRTLEKTYEARVKELKDKSSLSKIAKIENDRVIIPGVSDEALAKYRTQIIEFGRNLNGQMSEDNKADYRRDSILKSFMMFKNWIPKQVTLRTLDIQKNVEVGEWEYGRVRAFVKTWAHLGFANIFKMRDIIQGTDKGLLILDEMLKAKRADYFQKTGEQLEITDEEFYDMMRKELANQTKELGVLLGLMALLISAKSAVPPDDADDLTKNKYKWYLKMVNKISDEMAFYYNPASFESMTKGSVLPALGILTKVERFIKAFGNETYGVFMDDEELIKKSHPLKYFLDVIPVASQFNTEVMPYVFPEVAKEMGTRVSSEARR